MSRCRSSDLELSPLQLTFFNRTYSKKEACTFNFKPKLIKKYANHCFTNYIYILCYVLHLLCKLTMSELAQDKNRPS